jgi:hypothetical protein
MGTLQTARFSMAIRKARPALRLCALGALVLGGAAACERGLTSAPEGAANNETVTGPGSIAGIVRSVAGSPVAGAVVSTPGGVSTVTGPGGAFVLGGLPATSRLAVTVSAQEFAPTTAIYKVVPGATLSREITVLPRGPRIIVNSATGGVVPFAGGGRVTIPPNAFAGVQPGEPLGVQVTYYDPQSAEALRAAPGDFSATELNGTPSQLETAGMVDVRVTNAANQPVSVAPGQTVVINFPDRDGPATTSWGLYRFDITTGTWVRTGSAPPAPDGTQQATVPSLDRPWNADQPLVTSCITVKVQDGSGVARANESVRAEGVSYVGISSGWTDAAGNVDLRVKASSTADVSAGTATVPVSTPSAGPICVPGTTVVF